MYFKTLSSSIAKALKNFINSKPATIRIVTRGEFLYLGVESFLQILNVSSPSIIYLQFNIDGFPQF